MKNELKQPKIGIRIERAGLAIASHLLGQSPGFEKEIGHDVDSLLVHMLLP